MKFKYNIIASSSKGNCYKYCFNDVNVIVDIGISFKELRKYLTDVKYIFISHRHGDHFNKTNIELILKYFPKILIFVGEDIYNDYFTGLEFKNIMILKSLKFKNGLKVIIRKLPHDVLNHGFDFEYNDFKLLHATDLANTESIPKYKRNVVVLECNYEESVINENILIAQREKDYFKVNHLIRVKKTHLASYQYYKTIELIKPDVSIKAHQSKRNLKEGNDKYRS